MIRIRSRQDGFRRAGVAHPSKQTEYPDDFFTSEQIDAIMADDMLVAEIIPDRKKPGPKPKSEDE